MSNKINKTTSFLLYAADLDPDLLLRYGMSSAYIDDHNYEKPLATLNSIDVFVEFDLANPTDDFEDTCMALRQHSNFLDEYEYEHSLIFRFQLSEEWKHIKEELLTSKYSKIDREYVEKYFPKRTVESYDQYLNPIYAKSMNHMILTKDEELRQKWEEKLSMTIDPELEVWEKVHLHEEILNYKDDKNLEDLNNRALYKLN
jgi:hypothetical protein